MRARGQAWLSLAVQADAPVARVPPAPRPAPRPPVEARPRVLAVTGIRTLIRDPYAIYARHILHLYPLSPLHAEPDVRLRGSVLHAVLERFARERPEGETPDAARARLMQTTREVLETEVPWPSARALWQARLDRAAGHVVAVDAALGGVPAVIETAGAVDLPSHAFRLTAKPDRIDILPDGRVHLFDYKSGQPPTTKQLTISQPRFL